MKIQKVVWLMVVLVLLVAAALPVIGAGAAESTAVPFHAREYLVSGTESVVTTPGGNYHERGGTYETIEWSDNPCIDGLGFVTVKVTINKNGKFDVGGKFNIDPQAYEGVWKTMWHVNEEDLIVGEGYGSGELAGLKITYVFDGEEGFENGMPYMDYSGTILLPPNSVLQCAVD